jgi:hypothetical protein
MDSLDADILNTEKRITDLRVQIEKEKQQLGELKAEKGNGKKIDVKELELKVKNAEYHNSIVRSNRQYKRAEDAKQEKLTAYREAQGKLDAAQQEREQLLQSASFPIKGLSVTADGVTYNGIPLQQISDAEKIKIGIAISMALNPKLRVLRITDGSLLDTKSLQTIQRMADKHDYQIWIERVDESGKVGIYIEEGEVKNGK